MTETDLNDLAAIAIVCVPVVILAIVALIRRRQQALLVFGLLWFALLQLPGLITLTFGYYVNSPRLLYPSGPAMAWIWAALFAALLAPGHRRALRVVVVSTAVFAVVMMNIDFVSIRMQHYHIVEDSAHELGEIARDAPPDDVLLVVNMPSWLTPPERTFALGNNGIQFVPSYVGIEDVVFAANDEDHPINAVQFHNLRQPQPYYYGMYGQRTDWEALRDSLAGADQVYLTHYTPEHIDLTLAGRATGVGWKDGDPDPEEFVFGDLIGLALDDYEDDRDELTLSLNWQIRDRVTNDLTVFVHLYGPDGQLINQNDGYPLRGLSPFWVWEPGRTLQDQRTLSWPSDAPAGVYKVGVGIYDSATGERLPVVGNSGESLPEDTAVLLQIERP